MAKKRYVGFKFENPDDKEPVFDAKGIETVRRDGIPAQQKMTETYLKYVLIIQHEIPLLTTLTGSCFVRRI